MYKNNLIKRKKSVCQMLDWTISLGIIVGILTVVLAVIWTLWQEKKGGG